MIFTLRSFIDLYQFVHQATIKISKSFILAVNRMAMFTLHEYLLYLFLCFDLASAPLSSDNNDGK